MLICFKKMNFMVTLSFWTYNSLCLMVLFSKLAAMYLMASLISMAATMALVEAMAGMMFPEIYLTWNSFCKGMLNT